jgi:hypothetical protein
MNVGVLKSWKCKDGVVWISVDLRCVGSKTPNRLKWSSPAGASVQLRFDSQLATVVEVNATLRRETLSAASIVNIPLSLDCK